nr:serine protease inhibitor ecotin [Pseudomonas aeruginosa]
MKKITTLAVSLLTAACMSAGALAADQPLEKVAPFPKAEKGMKRQVIQLPQQQDESALKVELMIGQTLEVDCNHHRLGGELESKTLEGWGYDYYVFEKLSGPVSTMMACPDGKKEKKFVTAGLGDDAMLRYKCRAISAGSLSRRSPYGGLLITVPYGPFGSGLFSWATSFTSKSISSPMPARRALRRARSITRASTSEP